MSKRVILFLSLSCTLIAMVILFISLIVASPAYRLGQGTDRASRKFYFSKNVLPDHIMYPIFNLKDIIEIKMVDKDGEKVLLKVNIANKRLRSASEMMEKNELAGDLVVATLNKSHTYMADAMELFLISYISSENDGEEAAYYSAIFDQRELELEKLADKLNNSQRSRLDMIMEEERLMKQRIWQEYPNSFAIRTKE